MREPKKIPDPILLNGEPYVPLASNPNYINGEIVGKGGGGKGVAFGPRTEQK